MRRELWEIGDLTDRQLRALSNEERYPFGQMLAAPCRNALPDVVSGRVKVQTGGGFSFGTVNARGTEPSFVELAAQMVTEAKRGKEAQASSTAQGRTCRFADLDAGNGCVVLREADGIDRTVP